MGLGFCSSNKAADTPKAWLVHTTCFPLLFVINIMWIPTVHLLVERENGEIIAEGLMDIKQWCSGTSEFQSKLHDLLS